MKTVSKVNDVTSLLRKSIWDIDTGELYYVNGTHRKTIAMMLTRYTQDSRRISVIVSSDRHAIGDSYTYERACQDTVEMVPIGTSITLTVEK